MLGESIGGYQLVAKLGEGGMGVVYLGEHRRIARKAAIKLLRADLAGNGEMLERFFNEARATSMIRHPGIVEILDCDVLPSGDAFIVMELLSGESLATALGRERAFEVPRAVAVVRQIADALAAAHERGIVHRDLKPDNVFLVPSGAGGDSIKILDFGIAKLTNPELVSGQRMTHTGRLLGTPTYMSPEQCRGARDIDARTDVYALGCILFELVAGRPPFAQSGFGELVLGHLTFAPPRLRSLVPGAPPALDELVARMLAKPPAERPQTMQAVVAELDRLGGVARPTGKPGSAFPATVRMVGGPRLGTPPVGSRPAPSAPVVSAPAPVQTTLRSAASEHVRTAVAEDRSPGESPDFEPRLEIARTRRTWPLLVVATAALAAGFGYWRLRSPGVSPSPALPVATPAPAATAPPAGAPALAEAKLAVAPEPAPAAPPPVAPTPDLAAAAAEAKPAASAEAKPATVKITITSTPADADVCLARDHVLLGKTRYEWSPDRGSRVAKLWVRKSGYHGQQVVVSLDHDAKKHVELTRLGPDDIADLEACHR
jgi:serine/threonine-protein kinase